MFTPAFFGLFDNCDGAARWRVTSFLRCCIAPPGFGIWEFRLFGFWDFRCNPLIASPVFDCSVDAIWTWMILNLMRWSKLRFGMTMKRLANWCAGSIRLWRKWCGPISRDELLKRIFAK
jgi:hypothetical protein